MDEFCASLNPAPLMSVLNNTLFEAQGVSAFKIPPGTVSLSKWNPDTSNVVWKGNIRLIEQESTESPASAAVFEGLRLKLELFNKTKLGLEDVPWAEVWYNPMSELDNQYRIANDGEDTIRMSDESSKYYKIITQLPGTGYHPLDSKSNDKGLVLQVALGLKFDDLYAAVSFSEALGIYRKRFRSYQNTFLYDQHLSELQQKIMDNLRLPQEEAEKSPAPDFDDDEFGGFVGASYD